MDITRRGFIRLTSAGAVAGGVGLSALIDACAPAPAPKPTTVPAAGGTSTGPLPTYIAPTGGPKPDFHSADPRITDGFNRFPKDPVKSWSGGAPGTGGTLNVFMAGYYPVPTPHDQNPTWKEIEKALGGKTNGSEADATAAFKKADAAVSGDKKTKYGDLIGPH